MDIRLTEAAQTGNTESLYALIEENAYVLEGFDQIPFVETPLHIAAAAGHIDFAMQMMNLKPSFARKLNQSLYSPLHLAVRHGQTQMILWLIKFDKGLVRVKGRDGFTPFHCAVELGDLDVLVEFLTVCPESIKDVTIKGENALHIAVKANEFETLEVLVGWLRRYCHEDATKWEVEVINGKDKQGNTILHTAANQNDHQAIKLLLEFRRLKKNIKNSEGLTAFNILENTIQSRHMNNESIHMNGIEKQNFKRLTGCSDASSPRSKYFSSQLSCHEKILVPAIRWRMKITDEMSNAMLVVAALVLTFAFQGLLSPPGGVFQASSDNNSTSTRAGKTVMDEVSFTVYWCLNTLAMALTFLVTIYLLPPGYMSLVFNVALFWLFNGYANCVEVISPYERLGTVTRIVLGIPYSILWYYWHFRRRIQH